MKSIALIIVLVAAHFTSGQAQTLSPLTFASFQKSGTSTAATATNGVIVTLIADTNIYSWVVSDAVSQTAITDVYVTLVCVKGIVHVGPVVGASGGTTAALLGNAAGTNWKADFQSAYSGGTIAGGTAPATASTVTADQYIIQPGQTIRYTFDPTGSGTYMGVNIRDFFGTSIQNAPCNANNGAQSGQANKCTLYVKATATELGFELLNKGSAIFCVQTPAQFATGNSCDGESTKQAACTVAATGTTYTAAKCTAQKLYKNACFDACPTGSYAYSTDSTTGCVACYAQVSTNGFCSKTVAPASSSSLLRVGQIAAMFVGSIYFVLFA